MPSAVVAHIRETARLRDVEALRFPALFLVSSGVRAAAAYALLTVVAEGAGYAILDGDAARRAKVALLFGAAFALINLAKTRLLLRFAPDRGGQ